MKNFYIVYFLFLFANCKSQYSKPPYNDYEKGLRAFDADTWELIYLKSDWKNLDSASFLRFKNISNISVKETDSIPDWINRFQKVIAIDVYRSTIKNVPSHFFKKDSLIGVEFQDCILPSGFFSSICEAQKLEILNLTNSRIVTLPECLFTIKSLESVWLGNNKLEKLPETLGDATGLKKMRLNSNRLNQLPASICKLKQLEHLELNYNRLKNLSECINEMENLKELHLKDNKLTAVPESIFNLPKLKFIDLRGNPLKNSVDIKKRFKEKGVRCEID